MYDNETRSREIRGLLAASSAIGRDNLLIVTMDEETVIKQSGKDIHVVPAWKWALGKCLSV